MAVFGASILEFVGLALASDNMTGLVKGISINERYQK
jgi:hypothetical protein